MFVVVVYDVQSKTNPKILKLLRQYLFHVQNSVFEGSISEGILETLKEQLSYYSCDQNQFVLYDMLSEKAFHKVVLGAKMESTPFLS
ncbi:MAG: CRISPR-associated endonuclease Cas2 [Bacillota bacterium]|nr:CRISPR-associated endonuclease Cas2 [Bacillota bacterium]